MAIPLKSAAKKAFKDLKNNNKEIRDLSYTQFLTRFAAWCGYKDYHEYQTKVDQSQLKTNKPLTLIQKVASYASNSKTLMFARSGAGKTLLVREMILHMLCEGKKVRILDYGRSHVHFVQSLAGIASLGESHWHSDAMISLYDMDTNFSDYTLKPVKQDDVYYVVDEYWYVAKNIELSSFLKNNNYILISQSEDDFKALPNKENHNLFYVKEFNNGPAFATWEYSIKEYDKFFEQETVKKILIERHRPLK